MHTLSEYVYSEFLWWKNARTIRPQKNSSRSPHSVALHACIFMNNFSLNTVRNSHTHCATVYYIYTFVVVLWKPLPWPYSARIYNDERTTATTTTTTMRCSAVASIYFRIMHAPWQESQQPSYRFRANCERVRERPFLSPSSSSSLLCAPNGPSEV